ncbi:MAG: hypothetical protein GX422_12475 [Deltaproteobacteria bacterium]|jgi:hypothetical protein|nr:hypothetical protein [Deltaproteobacteria bacterium]
MARIVYCHPSQTKHGYHIYTDLDFWDVRRILRGLGVIVRRNFGEQPSGDEFPAQVIGDGLDRKTIREVEKRLRKALISPPRHVIVQAMVMEEFFEFDPLKYFPVRWSRSQMLRFTYGRLPLEQSSLCSPHKTIKVYWRDDRIRVQRVQRDSQHYPVISTEKEATDRLQVPSCF